MSALRFNLLAAISAFVIGTASESLRFPSNPFPQEERKLPTAVSATTSPTIIDCPRPPSHSSNTSRIASMVNQLVESKGIAKTNTFYVQEVDDEQRGGRFAQVYWKEDRCVIFISPPYDAENFQLEWTYSRRIDLDHDVVPNESDVGTTNYLVPKRWIEEVLASCVQNGVKITINNPVRNLKSRRQSHSDPKF